MKRSSKMPLAVLFLVVTMVAACFFVYTFYDVSRPVDYANKTQRSSARKPSEEPIMLKNIQRLPAEKSVAILVSGVVKDSKERPLGGTCISLMYNDVNLFSIPPVIVFTNDLGEFSVQATIANMNYCIDVKKDGYLPLYFKKDGDSILPCFKVPKEGISGITVTMRSAEASIEGRVVDQLGQPRSNVTVYANSSGYEDMIRHGGSSITGNDGSFSIPNLLPGVCNIYGVVNVSNKIKLVRGSNENPLCVLELSEGEHRKNVEVVIDRNLSKGIAGRVIDERGSPIAGASVWATDIRNNPVGGSQAITPSNGEFIVEDINSTAAQSNSALNEDIQQVVLHASCKDYTPRELENVSVGQKGLEIIMLQEAYGDINVTLTDSFKKAKVTDGNVYYLGTYTILNEPYKYTEKPIKFKKKGGDFICGRIPAGVAILQIAAEGYPTIYESDVIVEANKTVNVDVALNSKGFVCVDIIASPKSKEGWSTSIVDTFFIPTDMLGFSCPFDSVKDKAALENPCNNEESPGHIYAGRGLPPGECIVSFSGGVYSESTQNSTDNDSLNMISWFCNKRVQVSSGIISDLTFNRDELFEYSGMDIDLGNLKIGKESRLILIAGEYDGALESSYIEAKTNRFIPDYYFEYTPISAICNFPFVPSGNFTLLFFERFSDLECSKPSIKRLSISGRSLTHVKF